MLLGDGIAIAIDVLGAEGAEDLSYGCHSQTPLMVELMIRQASSVPF
jgi:hypothetical protein